MIHKKEINGWINFNKPLGMTSRQAVDFIKRIYQAKKAGHAGTLDPLAEGVLLVALGKGTKQVPLLMNTQKEYIFTVTFGAQTTTDDLEGAVIANSDQLPTIEDIKKILPRFTGTIEQLPPQFSALKIKGTPAYELARKGRKVEVRPREVMVYELGPLEWIRLTNTRSLRTGGENDNEKKVSRERVNSITLRALVSKGTYIRSLARDIGKELDCYGHVSKLIRTKIGNFTIEKAHTKSKLKDALNENKIREYLIPLDTIAKENGSNDSHVQNS